MKTTTTQTAREATIASLTDSAAVLRMLLARVESKLHEAHGLTADIKWPNAGDAAHDLSDFLDIAQRLFLDDTNDSEEVARGMALTMARAKFARSRS